MQIIYIFKGKAKDWKKIEPATSHQAKCKL